MIRMLDNVHGQDNFEMSILSAVDKCLPEEDKNLTYIEFEEIFSNLLKEIGCTILELSELIIVQCVFSTTGSMLDKVINRVDSKNSLGSEGYTMGMNRVNSMQSFANPDVGAGFGSGFNRNSSFADLEAMSRNNSTNTLNNLGGFSAGGGFGRRGSFLTEGGFGGRRGSFVTDGGGFGGRRGSFATEGGGFHRITSMQNFLQYDQPNADAGEEKTTDEQFEQEFKKALVDQRMHALFNLFDVENNGGISFKEVVLGLYKITDGLDTTSKAAVDALLMFDEDNRLLNYEDFAKLIINFVAASQKNVKFSDVADSMTRHAAQPMKMNADEVTHLFAMDNSLLSLKDLSGEEEMSNRKLSPAIISKICRLFKLWDEDKDKFINFHELALGLRKFQEATKIEDTVEQSLQVMTKFDSDKDDKLNLKEFSEFLIKYASMVGSSMTDLLDFMIVAGALKENSDTEKSYIQAISQNDIYYWGY